MAIIFQDDFTGSTIDTGKWTETDPNGRISQSGSLSISNPHSSVIALFVDQLQSVDSISSGVAVAQGNITWSDDSTQEAQGGIMLYKDDNNYAYIGSRTAPSGELRLIVHSGGSQVYSNVTGIAKNKDVKIWTDGTDIKFYYWNGSSWTQMGTTQTYSLGYDLYVMLSSADSNSWDAADTITIDDIYFSDADYSTQYPPPAVVITPSAQVATFSIPSYSVGTGNTQSPNTQAATFSIGTPYTVSAGVGVSPAVQVATFTIPAYTIDAGDTLINASVQDLTFSIPAYTPQASTTVYQPNQKMVVDLDDAQSDYLDYADAGANVVPPASGTTLEAWVKVEGFGASDQYTIFSKGDLVSGSLSYAWRLVDLGSGQIGMELILSDDGTTNVGNSITFTSVDISSQLTAGWAHIAVAFVTTTETCVMYVNNQTVSNSLSAGTTMGASCHSSTEDVVVGAAYSSSSLTDFFNGRIAHLTVWGDVRTGSEIDANYDQFYLTDTDQLFIAWRFNGDGVDQQSSLNLTARNTTEFVYDFPPFETSELTFSIPSATVSLPKTVSVGVQSATFTVPAYSLAYDFTVSPSAIAATFSIPTYTVSVETLVAVAAQSATFSIPVYTAVGELNAVVSPDTQVATFSIPTLARFGAVWAKTARATDSTWSRSSRNST